MKVILNKAITDIVKEIIPKKADKPDDETNKIDVAFNSGYNLAIEQAHDNLESFVKSISLDNKG